MSRELHELGSANPDRVGENIAAFERLLAHNRDAKIVWVHLGIDSTGQRTVALMRRLLMTHPNLYVSITGAQARTRLNRLFVAGVGLDPAWRKLIVEYPDRFMIGSDQFFQSDRPARRWPPFIEPAIRIVRTPGALPPEVARKVAFENAQRVFGLDLLRVDDVPFPAQGQQSLGARSTAAPATAGQATPVQAEMLGPRGLTARQVVANSDQDGDARISRDEFRGPPPAFPRIDADGDGLLTREELEAFWRRRGLGSTGG